MTKSAKHKKEFRKEKNKIKLKLTARAARPRVGKAKKTGKTQFLPKGLNVTDTSFKTKKIVLPENLKPDENSGVPLTSRKQTFKELMSHMGHFNTTIQQDGINGMKELLVKFPNILVLNLSSLFGKLSELLSAGDSGVRKCSMKLLEHIIQSVPKEKIAPFFPLLNAQLMCSMNHIALDIQKDSHTILDLLLANIPDLVATVVMQILPNFLDQISCRDDSKAGKRILAINPNQRLTSLKWRQEVLTRIHRLLCLLISNENPTAVDCSQGGRTVCYDQSGACPLYIHRNFQLKLNIQPPGCALLSQASSSSPNHPLQDFINHFLPLLFETWIETLAGEQLSNNQGASLIGTESCALLACTTNVLLTLRKVFAQSEERIDLLTWFEKQYGEPMIRHFMHHFPFSSRLEPHRGKNSGGANLASSCREHNIALCFLWAQVNIKSAAKFSPAVFQYLCGVFQTADRLVLTTSELDHVKNIVLSSRNKKSLFGHVNDLVESAVEFSRRIRPERKDRLVLNHMLMEIGQSVELGNIPALKEWIETCPALLRQEGNGPLLGAINRVISRNAVCLANGRTEVPYLLDNLERYGGNQYEWKTVFNFFYWTRDGNQDVVDLLRKHLDRIEDPAIKSYGLGVLHSIQN